MLRRGGWHRPTGVLAGAASHLPVASEPLVSADGTGTKITLPALNSSQSTFTPSSGGTIALKDTTLTS